jgi:Uma2 family endonuclease
MTVSRTQTDVAGLEVRRFTVQDLYEMERAGILREGERVELLYGNIVTMTPVNPPHAFAVDALHERFVNAFGSRTWVRSQNPLRLSDKLSDDQLPLPDVLLLRRRAYTDHPLPEDVYLLVEVADTTLEKDRRVKVPLYAEAGIREVWLVNLVDQAIEVFTEPADGAYRSHAIHELTDSFAPQHFPEAIQLWLPEALLE